MNKAIDLHPFKNNLLVLIINKFLDPNNAVKTGRTANSVIPIVGVTLTNDSQ